LGEPATVHGILTDRANGERFMGIDDNFEADFYGSDNEFDVYSEGDSLTASLEELATRREKRRKKGFARRRDIEDYLEEKRLRKQLEDDFFDYKE